MRSRCRKGQRSRTPIIAMNFDLTWYDLTASMSPGTTAMTTNEIWIISGTALAGFALAFFIAWVVMLYRAAKLRAENARLQSEGKLLNNQLTQVRNEHDAELQRLRNQFIENQKEQQHRWEADRKSLVSEFKNLATETLQERSRQLKTDNTESMDALLKPLHQQLNGLSMALQEAQKNGLEGRTRLEERLVQMTQKTDQISKGANELANALRGNHKLQGQWGEMILEKMLENSGLRRNEHYRLQEDFKDDDTGKKWIPDAVVMFPRNRSLIIDAKVSLNDYIDYVNAPNEQTQQEKLKRHLIAVRDHIDRLASKNYAALRKENVVEDTIDYVLMFMPNEGGYIAALQADPNLINYAHSRKILLVGPTSLSMALALAQHLWLNETQLKNASDVFSQARKLYDAFGSYYKTFTKIQSKILELQNTYNEAEKKWSAPRSGIEYHYRKLGSMGIDLKMSLGEPNAEELRDE